MVSTRRASGFVGLVAGLLAAAAPLSAQGTSGLEFLTVPMGARAVGLGESFTGVAEGLEGVVFNPASLASLRERGISMSVLDAPDLFTQGLISFATPALGAGALGLAINYQRLEAIPMTDLTGERVGEFAPQTIVVSGSFGYRLSERLQTGISIKWLSSELASQGVSFLGREFSGSASGVAFDLGLTYAFSQGTPVRLGVALLDLGPDVTFNQRSDRLPTRLRLGAAARPLALFGGPDLGPVDLLLVTDGVLRTEGVGLHDGSLGYGVELGFDEIVYLRGGVAAEGDTSEGRPIRYGLGLAYGSFRFDMARRLQEDPVLGQETHLTLGLTF